MTRRADRSADLSKQLTKTPSLPGAFFFFAKLARKEALSPAHSTRLIVTRAQSRFRSLGT
ncbi:hypothetical protein BMI90_13900 [Thioclava sp. L04-15]|jgi:hypothetical protein|nr:hypothetical protein BMI90_13900 [Thioclava sp. L04-15]